MGGGAAGAPGCERVCRSCVNPPAAAGAAGAIGVGGIVDSGGFAVDEAGGVDSVCKSCVKPPAAAGAAGADGADGDIGDMGKPCSAGFACSVFKACINCVKPPCAGEDGPAGRGVSLNPRPLSAAGSVRNDLKASSAGACDGACAGLALENICVNDPGAPLRGGSGAAEGGADPNEPPA